MYSEVPERAAQESWLLATDLAEALARTGLTVEQLRERETPEMRRATYRVPRYGVVGTAANYALHLAQC